MGKTVSKNGNSLIINFRYEPRIINAVRELDGRKFNPEEKCWEVPAESIIECLDSLKPLGFTVTSDVETMYEARKKELAVWVEIKRSNAIYNGKLPLFDFQKTGAVFMKTLPSALLADVPGLGKTIQTAAALEETAGPKLVLCPASLKFNWRDEIKKWLPKQETIVIHGDKAERIKLWQTKKKDAYFIANYELLLHDFAEMPKEWKAIICDEADRVSNPFSKTTKALKMLKSEKRMALTGTPISNTPEDLWSIADWLYPRYLGTYTQFQKKYCKLHPQWGRVIGYMNLDELRKRIEPIMLRRLKEDVLKDFPPKTIEHIKFELSAAERDFYESVKKLIIADIKKMSDLNTRSLMLLPVKMLRLKQATDHLSLLDIHSGAYISSSKLATLKELLQPIVASGEKTLVFTQFAEMAHILKKELAEYNPLVIWGGVDSLERKMIVDEFSADPEKKVLIMTEAGTYGLNLQAASYVCHYDSPWSVAKLEQREGRAHRIGQDKPVTVYYLIAKKTIDEHVLKILTGKKKMSDEILGDIEDPQLSFADIEEILGEEIS